MSYLLDTNVLSELVRAKPAPAVLRWFADVPNEALFVSVLSLGEIRKGIERAPDHARREKLRVWLEHDLPDWLGQRLLPVDAATADAWGLLCAAHVHRPLPVIDSLLAATALTHHLRLATRNAQDFDYPGLEVVNPWMDASDAGH